MAKIKITLVKSSIGSTQRQKLILESLGLRKMHHSVEHEASPSIMGMVNKLNHLVQVKEI
ncbi:MAG: 50S ribosomal protein L30 [Prolixibacteraceae bacterium]